MAKIPISKGVKNLRFLKFIRFGFLIFFFIYLFLSAGLTAIQQQDVNIFFKEIGEEIINPLQDLQQNSIDVYQGESSLGTYFDMLFNFYVLFLWFKVIMLLIVNPLLKDTNPFMIRFLFGLIIFIGLILFYSVGIAHKGLNYPIEVFSDVFKGITHLFTNFSFTEGKESVLGSKNDCVEEVCVF